MKRKIDEINLFQCQKAHLHSIRKLIFAIQSMLQIQTHGRDLNKHINRLLSLQKQWYRAGTLSIYSENSVKKNKKWTTQDLKTCKQKQTNKHKALIHEANAEVREHSQSNQCLPIYWFRSPPDYYGQLSIHSQSPHQRKKFS